MSHDHNHDDEHHDHEHITIIDENGNGVSRSNKQQIESSTILSEPVSKFFGNSKDNVSMRAVKTKRSGFGCKLFGIFNTTCITEPGMA